MVVDTEKQCHHQDRKGGSQGGLVAVQGIKCRQGKEAIADSRGEDERFVALEMLEVIGIEPDRGLLLMSDRECVVRYVATLVDGEDGEQEESVVKGEECP
jgi:hypothetical protein